MTLDEFKSACERLAAEGPPLIAAVGDLGAWGELRNALERAVILAEGGLITAQHLSLHADQPVAASTTTDLAAVERETIARVMQETGGNKSRAADRLGLTRTQLYVRLRKYKLL